MGTNWKNTKEGVLVAGIFCKIDDKHVPLYRVMWVADTPHFCGDEECQCEGQYEIRLEHGEAVWGSRQDRNNMLASLESWHGGLAMGDEDWE